MLFFVPRKGHEMETSSFEIDEGAGYVGYREAFDLICANIQPIGAEEIALQSSANRIASEDTSALVSYPSADASLKDGFAVRSADVAQASRQRPVTLKVTGSVFAGSSFNGKVESGCAVKVCSGAPIPSGADAVVSAEFCEQLSVQVVQILADAGKGRNVLKTGEEVLAGATVIQRGDVFLPGTMGLAAAAGISRVGVYRLPRAAVVGVGDEVVAAGGHFRPGQVYASNLITLAAWLNSFGIECATSVVGDNVAAITRELEKQRPGADVILTSGGAWGSERDLVIGTLGEIGWKKIFHHVRMGPGKGIAFGMWRDKPIFCLPGGPASNEMAFLQLALPGMLRMSGDLRHPLQSVPARLAEEQPGMDGVQGVRAFQGSRRHPHRRAFPQPQPPAGDRPCQQPYLHPGGHRVFEQRRSCPSSGLGSPSGHRLRILGV
jgi:molybdopterin molybdotransferase